MQPSRRQLTITNWVLAGGVFAMITSESLAAGLLPSISTDTKLSIGLAANLISVFAAGQVVGAWVLGVPLSRWSPRVTLPTILLAFAVLQVVGVASPWSVTLGARLLCGALMTAFFAIALGTVTRLNSGRDQPRATATVFVGGTLGTTLGLPLATFAGGLIGWRGAFWLDAAAAVCAAIAIALTMPHIAGVMPVPLADLIRPLRSGRLWLTFATAAFTIAAALLGFSFFSTILERVTGVDPAVVPWLLALYGASSILGTIVVGRISHTGPTRIVAIGLIVLIVGLIAFWLAPAVLPIAVVAIVTTGISGVSLNAAQTMRNIEAGGNNPAVMAMAPTVVTAGILIGTSIGARTVDTPLGLLSPLWIGAALATVALALLLPDLSSATGSHRAG